MHCPDVGALSQVGPLSGYPDETDYSIEGIQGDPYI